MSIVRVGLAETKNFAEGYEAIFGKKSAEAEKPAEGEQSKAAPPAAPAAAGGPKEPEKK